MAWSLQKSTVIAGIALSAWSVAAGSDAQLLHPGETVRGVMPPGDPARTSVAFDLDTPESGAITISARSFDFDTAVKVSELGPDGSFSPLGEDDDGGTGSDSRLEVVVTIGVRYRIEVRPSGESLGGDFELSVVPGKAAAAPNASTKAAEDLAYWRRAESAARLNGNAIREARALVSQGRALQALGEHAAVRSLCERATAIFEGALPPDHPDLADSLGAVAILLWTEGEYTPARPLLERVLAIKEKAFGSGDAKTAPSLTNLAALLWDMGEYPPARPLLERALAIFEAVLPPGDGGRALGLNNLGRLLQDMGEYQTARTYFERALAIREKALGPEDPFTALSLINLALSYQAMGEYSEARPLLERALAVFEKVSGPENPYTAKGLNSLAQLLQTMGEYAAARPLLERALAIRETVNGPEHPDTATTLNSLCSLLQAMGEYAAARPRCEQALAIREKALGPEHPEVARTLDALASLLQATGHDADAQVLVERAVAIKKAALGSDHPDVAASLISFAHLQAIRGNSAGALDSALESERIAREHLKLTCRSLSERQALRYAAARTAGLNLALTLAARGLDSSSRRRVFDALIRSRAVVLDEMAARHRSLGSKDPEVSRRAGALSAARTRLANLVVNGPGDKEPELYRKLLDEARVEKEKSERGLAEASAGFARELSRDRLGFDDVAASLPAGSAVVAFSEYTKLDLASGKHGLKPRQVPSYLAFVVRAGDQDVRVVDLGTVAAIDSLVARWRSEASGGALRSGLSAERSAAAYGDVGTALRKRVWDPLAPAVGDAGRVFIVPDGSLNLVNMAALPMDDGGFLIEHGPLVHFVSAERDLVPSSGTRHGEGLLVLGAPSYDATSMFASLRSPDAAALALIAAAGTSTYRGQHAACGEFSSARFGSLSATGKETRDIVRMWEKHFPDAAAGRGSVVDLRDAAASETALTRSAPGRRVLHLATHGFFLGGGACPSALASARGIGGLAETPVVKVGENPMLLSGLVLAGANHRSAAGLGEDDGILTAEEIASLDLSGVEWAVLSACETGIGDIRAGEGVFGLRRAFQVAGVDTLIMSLWSVDDDATRAWMKALYAGRLEAQLDTAEAVRHASLDVLHDRRARKRSTHPFYWAAFVAAGDWR